MDLLLKENRNRARNQPNVLNLKKIVYNNSSKKLTSSQEKLLELGLHFAVTLKFPLIEHIVAAEDRCQTLEEHGDNESVENAQKIRNIMIDHVRKGVGMNIKHNLSADEKKILAIQIASFI